MNVIPAIDLRAGAVVRLRQGDFAHARQFDCEPVALARRYAEAGAGRLHVVDLDGARAGVPAQLALLGPLVDAGLAIQWGGGVRSLDDIERVLEAGAARVVVGSVAVLEPDRFVRWLARFGAGRLVLALDVRLGADGRWRPATQAWQQTSDVDAGELLDRFAAAGITDVLSTDIGSDGMGAGPNLALYRWLLGRWPDLHWIASGGVRDRHDLDALAELRVPSCVAGTALLDGTLPLRALRGADA
jgi:phosphoribosylformimino-5-aminoimidazole carboxamide ribotide isomerase